MKFIRCWKPNEIGGRKSAAEKLAAEERVVSENQQPAFFHIESKLLILAINQKHVQIQLEMDIIRCKYQVHKSLET